VRGGVWNLSLPACGLKISIGSAPDETITIICAAVVVSVRNALEAQAPPIAVWWLFDFLADFD